MLARRLLPFVLLTPLLIGWLRLKGQQMGLYDTAFGVAVRTVVETALLAALIFWGLRAIRTREAERDRLDSALRATERRLAGTLEGPGVMAGGVGVGTVVNRLGLTARGDLYLSCHDNGTGLMLFVVPMAVTRFEEAVFPRVEPDSGT